MRTLTAVAPFLLVLFGIAQGFPNFPSQLDGGTSLQNRIKSASKDLGVPEWKMWDIWWQLRSCKYYFFFLKDSYDTFTSCRKIQQSVQIHIQQQSFIIMPISKDQRQYV